jgi:hypothetical protein
MFPNVRLLIASLLTSVVALSGGFGVFAAFRVNHDPLSPLPADTAPLQLVANPMPSTAWGAPFGSSFRLSEAQIGSAITDAPAPAAARRDAIEPANAGAARTAEPAANTDVPQQLASQPTAPSAPLTPTPTIPDTAAQQMPTPEASVVQPPPGVNEQATAKSSEPAKADPPVVAATEPAGGQAQPVARPADVTAAVPETAAPDAQVSPRPVGNALPSPPGKTVGKTVRKAVARRRVVDRKPIVGTKPGARVAQSGGQNSTFQEPIFQSSPHTVSKVQTRPATANDKIGTADGPFLGPQ